jgi:hypothetical protein
MPPSEEEAELLLQAAGSRLAARKAKVRRFCIISSLHRSSLPRREGSLKLAGILDEVASGGALGARRLD